MSDGKIVMVAEKLLSVIIPVYNEERDVVSLVEAVEKIPITKEILLVNDEGLIMTRSSDRRAPTTTPQAPRLYWKSRNHYPEKN